jgi:medium-chain acyl-[acyl-carrier-protein] hydrolase
MRIVCRCGEYGMTEGVLVEKDHVYEVEIEVSDLDENSLLKPHAYQALFARLAEKHLNLLNLNVDMTLTHDLAWALVSMSLEFLRPVTSCMRLFATTWHSQRKGPYFRRELVFRNGDGEVMFHGSTFSVLLDLGTRSVYRKKELPFHVHDAIEEFTIGASPTVRNHSSYILSERRTVRNSHIDPLGHVNNCRYGEFAHDALTEQECANLCNLRRMDIHFVSELRKGDAFSIWKACEVQDTCTRIMVRGRNDGTDAVSFDIMLTFTR